MVETLPILNQIFNEIGGDREMKKRLLTGAVAIASLLILEAC